MKIEGSAFVVTGGASGLGHATATQLVAHGGRVVIADVNEEVGKRAAGELGGNARFIRTDVCDEASARAAIGLARSAFGGLHGLVNCAGIFPAEAVLGKGGVHRLDVFSRVLQVNVVGTFNMLRLAAEAMSQGDPNEEGERGVIVNTASAAAFEGQIGQAAYAASKGSVVSMTLPVARELARFGIRVMTIAPGVFGTPALFAVPKELQEALIKPIPFPPRFGRPSEFAQLVRQIFENPMLNGATIRLDAALRMGPK
ncbi:MAG: SDR family NAD(P)-dependent oxidoreductase [Betaproteobacteria bacterium]|nr:SDR family NAD(P)-dependent oxidoreductase [Betaproteobacteria bacterium]